MRVGVFGGSFNPPHVGHLVVAEYARVECRLDRVLWIPNNVPPHKSPHVGATNDDRLRMVKLAIADNPAFDVTDIELKRVGPSYTVDTLVQLTDEDPKVNYFLIVGMDSLVSFGSWRMPDEIVQRARLAVYPRHGFAARDGEERFLNKCDLFDAPTIDVSSTIIRQRIREGRSVRYLVPADTHAYIDGKQLYRD